MILAHPTADEEARSWRISLLSPTEDRERSAWHPELNSCFLMLDLHLVEEITCLNILLLSNIIWMLSHRQIDYAALTLLYFLTKLIQLSPDKSHLGQRRHFIVTPFCEKVLKRLICCFSKLGNLIGVCFWGQFKIRDRSKMTDFASKARMFPA